MRLASFVADGTARFGAVEQDQIIDLTGTAGCATLREALEKNALGRLQQAVQTGRNRHTLSSITLLPPIPAPEKIVCVGVNYADRNAEYKDNSTAPTYPSLFVRFPGSFVGHLSPIERPRVSTHFDYEGEIVLVISRAGRHIPEDEALDHIAGLTLANEGSVRDWLRHGKFNVTQGKNFDRSGSMGPWMVTSDALDLRRPLTLTTRVNGEVRQHDSTERLMFPFARLIAYLSTFTTLNPGDVILTGTPTGAGARFDPPKYLVPGDVVEVEVAGIGCLRNTVVDEA